MVRNSWNYCKRLQDLWRYSKILQGFFQTSCINFYSHSKWECSTKVTMKLYSELDQWMFNQRFLTLIFSIFFEKHFPYRIVVKYNRTNHTHQRTCKKDKYSIEKFGRNNPCNNYDNLIVTILLPMDEFNIATESKPQEFFANSLKCKNIHIVNFISALSLKLTFQKVCNLDKES